MKNLNLLLTGMILLSFGCNTQPELEEVYTTTLGIGTPNSIMPEVLNGKVKEVKEKIYLAVD